MVINGRSCAGKTTLLRNMIAWDIHPGLGTSVLDPRGSLIDDVLEMIPRSRINDVICFNPKERSRVLGINILKPMSEDYQPFMVSYLISIFKALWHDSWGPRLEDILRNSAFALMEQPAPVSLVAIPGLLTEANYRADVLRKVSNPVVRNFFRIYEEHWDKRFREEAISQQGKRLHHQSLARGHQRTDQIELRLPLAYGQREDSALRSPGPQAR